MIGTLHVVFKKRLESHEYCTICNEFLSGNGSTITPWKCACGEYRFNRHTNQYVHPVEQSNTNKEQI